MLRRLLKRQKTITGSQIGQVSDSEKDANKKSSSVRKLFKFKLSKKDTVIGVVVVFTLVVGLGIYYYSNKSDGSNTRRANELLQADTSDSGKAEIVKKFGTDYNNATKELSTKNPTEWDKSSLEKAYLSLLYADKVGAFTQVYAILSQIDHAQKNGLDVDNNIYGINQQMRDEIRQRADRNSQGTSNNSTGDTSE